MKKFLIVGIGNIGKEYDNTRHNVGFQILDYISKEYQEGWALAKDTTERNLQIVEAFNTE